MNAAHLAYGLIGAGVAGVVFAVAERLLDWLTAADRRQRRALRRSRRLADRDARIAAARARRDDAARRLAAR